MKIKKEVQIGLLAIIALVICYVGINFLKGIEVFKKSTTYYAHFDNLSSVTVATPVIISGFKVGTVRDVQFDYARGYGATVELALMYVSHVVARLGSRPIPSAAQSSS